MNELGRMLDYPSIEECNGGVGGVSRVKGVIQRASLADERYLFVGASVEPAVDLQ